MTKVVITQMETFFTSRYTVVENHQNVSIISPNSFSTFQSSYNLTPIFQSSDFQTPVTEFRHFKAHIT